MMEDKNISVGTLPNDATAKLKDQLINFSHVVTPTVVDVDNPDEIIGADDDELSMIIQESERIAGVTCKNVLNAHSIMVNNKNISKMEKVKFTPAELSVITNRYNEIHSSANESIPFKENLIAFYMSTDSSLTKEDAEKVVVGLITGVEDLTTRYNTALLEGWDPKEHIEEMVAGMNLQQRYGFLVNAISIANSLNVNTIGELQDIQASINEVLEKMKAGNIEITESLCAELQDSLSDLLSTSPLMLINEKQIKEMMNAANGCTANVVDFTSSQYNDYRYKTEMALAAWIEYKKGELTTLPADVLPEALGVSIAAGIEEAHILEEVATGSKPLEWAIKCLKVLGAIALICFLGYIALLGMVIMAGAFLEASILVMGTSTVAIIVAAALSFLVSWGYSDAVINAGTKILEWSGEAYDWVVAKLKDNVYPAIKTGFAKLVSWFRSLFTNASSAISTQEALG